MLPRLALTVVFVALVRSAGAQPSNQIAQPSPPAYVAAADGVAFIERDSRAESSPLNMPLVAGDRLHTTEGRMEIRFADGSVLDLDARTIVDLESDTVLRLMDGRIRMTVSSAAPDRWRIDSPAGSARLTEAGEYRLALVAGPRQEEGDVQLEFAVFRGSGEIFTDHGTTTVSAGQRAYASADLLPSEPFPFDVGASDDFDRWPASPAPLSAEPSSEYLPSDLESYSSTLDAYGDWLYLPAYGHVWCPRVTAGWRPYAFGRWMTYPRYGLTWVGSEPFAWPTHHYGSWDMVGGRWLWIPSTTWAPARVRWVSAGDSVGWVPLGPGNRAVDSTATRTVMARSDFDRHTIVSDARPIDQTRRMPVDQTRMKQIDQLRAGPRAAAVPRPVAPSSAPQPMGVPARTSPPLNPVPRSQVPPAPAVPSPSIPIGRTQPSPAAQPRPAQAPAPAVPSTAVPGQPAAPQPVAQHPAAHQPAAHPTTEQPQRGTPPPAQQPAQPVSRGRGGV